MGNIVRDFVSEEARDFKYRVGKVLASSLAGFLAGVVSASIVWAFIVYANF